MRSSCCNHVKPENSARPFRNPAPIFQRPKVVALLEEAEHHQTAIEIGAGCLRNALFLQRRGLTVSAVDVPGVRARFSKAYNAFESAGGRFFDLSDSRTNDKFQWDGPYDLVVSTFVVETICDPLARLALLRRCLAVLAPRGTLVLAVRGVADVVTASADGIRCSDGYITPNRTFIRAYTRPQLARVLRRAGFRAVEFLHKPSTVAPEYLYALARRR